MIPTMNLVAWGNTAPWAEQRQIEQDLIISRALVELFSDEFLRAELRFRGGTALNKLHFPQPMRYSEDIDLVRTTHGPIKDVVGRVRDILQAWLGEAGFKQSPVAPRLTFRVPAEDGGAPLRMKVEINTHEVEAYDSPQAILYAVDNPWFTGQAKISTFSREEMLATKLRALLQRNKGRDLFDLSHALAVFQELDAARVTGLFEKYLEKSDLKISRAQAEQRMFSKLISRGFLTDMRPLLAPAAADALTDAAAMKAFADVFTGFVIRLPGDPWVRTEEMAKRFRLFSGESEHAGR